jgi:hypothetical protein
MPTTVAAVTTANQLGLSKVDLGDLPQHIARADPNMSKAKIVRIKFSGAILNSAVPRKVPAKPRAEKVNPTLKSTVPLFLRLSTPARAAEPTIIVELVVAAVADNPSMATNPGTAKIAPPAPIKPKTLPTVAPKSRPRKSVSNIYALLLYYCI